MVRRIKFAIVPATFSLLLLLVRDSVVSFLAADGRAANLLPRQRFINLYTTVKPDINSLLQDGNRMIWAGGNNGYYRREHDLLRPRRPGIC